MDKRLYDICSGCVSLLLDQDGWRWSENKRGAHLFRSRLFFNQNNEGQQSLCGSGDCTHMLQRASMLYSVKREFEEGRFHLQVSFLQSQSGKYQWRFLRWSHQKNPGSSPLPGVNQGVRFSVQSFSAYPRLSGY